MKKKKYDLTEGEEIIKDYLDSEDIKYEIQKEIGPLIEDSYEKRISDFYLTQYKVHVEFFGQWGIEKHKARYKEKRDIYQKNKVPCIYFYPENLGFLDKIFKRRLKKVLQDNKALRWQLFRLNWQMFQEQLSLFVVLLVLLVFYVDGTIWKVFFSLVALYQFYLAARNSFFKRIVK
ncbi:MAG: hypothetical protein NUV97_01255 [archaeon]|nr:hypothetical protein [archaeon]MCR4323410.1 hypothetical protein [Nanoarchaeota archaeon]